jgi:outer membrane protein W
VKKLLVSLLFLTAISGFVVADEKKSGPENSSSSKSSYQPPNCSDQPSIEARVSFYGFMSDDLSDPYGTGAADYQLTATIPVRLWNLQAWLAADYLFASGHVGGIDSNIQLIPGTLGLKYMPFFGCFIPYVGAGLKWFWVIVHNDGGTVKKTMSDNRAGGVVEMGVQYLPIQHLVVEFFFNYSFAWFDAAGSGSSPNVVPTSLNVSGLSAGGGIGYRF